MRVKKNDLVRFKKDKSIPAPVFKGTGIVLKGPYEDQLKISNSPLPVSTITLVVDVMANGEVWEAIPIEFLERLRN